MNVNSRTLANSLPTSRAFAYTTFPCSFAFHVYTHFAETTLTPSCC